MPHTQDGRLSIQALCSPMQQGTVLASPVTTSTPTSLAPYTSNTTATPTTYSPSSTTDDEDSMSFTSGLSIDDPDVRLAAEALEDLRCDYAHEATTPPAMTSTLSNPAGSSLPPPRLPSTSTPTQQAREPSQFLDRISNYTLVSSAVRAYESGKSYSRGFKYGAEMVESVARPVVRRIEPLALRQLDKLEKRSSVVELPPPVSARGDYASTSRWQSVITNASGLTVALSDDSIRSLRYCLQWLKYANSHLEKATLTLQRLLDDKRNTATASLARSQSQVQQQRAQKRKRGSQASSASTRALLAEIAKTKADIVVTIRRVVSVVSTYAGAALPEPARSHVRNYVLALPARWAQASAAYPSLASSRRSSVTSETPAATHSLTTMEEGLSDEKMPLAAVDDGSEPLTRTASEVSTTETYTDAESNTEADTAREHASRVIVFASEALQMLTGITHIVSETLDRAEGWCDRFGRRVSSSSTNSHNNDATSWPSEKESATQTHTYAVDEKHDIDGDSYMHMA
ncbi:transcription factor Opi1-domain-containing protein [Limtongia smithiae]|uniref:transcription factor Opi1-domain-containing protein n=1 Tax=Limtongia smithiae TaxID=1125753 RepID=UPI0034CD28EB